MESSSLKILYDEHDQIVKAIEIARDLAKLVGVDNEKYEKDVRELIHFFRAYADQYHHYKEEEILFPEMAKKNELIAGGIISEMLDNHSDFRELIREMEQLLQQKRYDAVATNMAKYTEALLDHIAVENEELFQTAYSLFTDEELENIYGRFQDVDRELGDKKKIDLADMVAGLDASSGK